MGPKSIVGFEKLAIDAAAGVNDHIACIKNVLKPLRRLWMHRKLTCALYSLPPEPWISQRPFPNNIDRVLKKSGKFFLELLQR